MNELILVALPAVPFVIARFGRHWRFTVGLVMVFMVFEGAFRKWLFPSLQAQIYLLKDALVLFALIGYLADRQRSGSHEQLMITFKWTTFAGMLFCFLQMANPNNPSPLIWLIGFKSYFLYIGLLFMTPYVFTSPEHMEKKLKVYMIVMIPVALLGLVQFFFSPDHWINVQVAHQEDDEFGASSFGEDNRARASGTFSFIGGFATFVPAMFAISAAMLLGGSTAAMRNRIPLAMLTSCLLAMFATGSRTVVLSIAMMGAIILLLGLRAGLVTAMIAFRTLIVGGTIGVLVWLMAGVAFDAFVHRAENADDPIMRLLSPFEELLRAFLLSPVFGTGLGTSHNSASTVMQSADMWWLHGNHFELETARVMQELGIVGFILIYAPRVALIFVALGMVRRLKTPMFKAMSAAIAAYFIPQLFLFVINNPTGGLFFWFAAGMLYGMYRLDFAPQHRHELVPQVSSGTQTSHPLQAQLRIQASER